MSRGTRSRGISTRAVECVVSAAILGFGALVVFDSLRLGARWGEDGPQAGYFPFYIGAILCVCGAALLVAANVPRNSSAIFVSKKALRQVGSVLGPAALYVIAIHLIGLYVASAVYIAFFMVWLGRYRVTVAAAIGIGVMAAFFLAFEVWFKVPLYKGVFDPLAFLGY